MVTAAGKSVPLNGITPRYQYWGTSDTYLDATSPMENNGDSHVLEGGPGRTMLMKFGDLERLGRHKVLKATLYLTPSIGGKPHLSSIRSLLVPWGEGPLRRPFFTDKPLVAADWSATWKDRHSGVPGMEWQQNGAASPGDAAVIDGATLTDTGKEIAISGIEGAVQNMMDRWYQNNGFALMFSAPTEFFSSKNVTGKPRLELELGNEDAPSGPDLSVTLIDAKYDDPNANPPAVWPKDGSNVTYVAHVKNVGNAAADGFIGAWSVREKPGSGFEVSKKLAPGEETTVDIKRSYHADSADHRLQPLGFLIKPKGADATPGNDYLEIQENAIPVKWPENGPTNNVLSRDYSDYAQRLLRESNAILSESRFSFAPEGCLERFRLANVPTSLSPGPVGTVLRARVAGIDDVGLLDYSKMQPSVAEIEGSKVAIYSKDRFPGLLGGGCSADDISVPGEIQLPYMANYNEVFDQYELQPTGLLAASDVAALNANLGKPVSSMKTLGKLPGTVLIRALNMDGDPLPNTELRFYQSRDGQMQTSEPTFRLVTGDNGSVLLPARVGADGAKDQFGGLSPDGSNGVYLIAATVNGVTDYTWLKAWQLCDSYSRTGKPAVFSELRFNVPYQEVDASKNLASGATFSDSAKDDPKKLAALADDSLVASVEVPNQPGAWIEIDLGKDQPVTEIDVRTAHNEPFWKRFDIVTYFTGEAITQASPYAHEIDWDWNLATRPMLEGSGEKYLAYRGQGKSVRYIRIICKEATSSIGLSEIRVYGAKAPSS